MTILPTKTLTVLALLALAACSQPRVPEDHFYRLTLAGPASALAARKLPGTVMIDRFVADGLTAGRPIVFTEAGRDQIAQAYHYHFWIEPPTIMLQIALADYLRAAKIADEVVTPALQVEPDYVVAGRIRRFEHVRGDPGRVTVEVELSLKQTRTERLLVNTPYRVELATADNTVGEAAAQMSRALDQIYTRFLQALPAG